jgi:hypothetical protein
VIKYYKILRRKKMIGSIRFFVFISLLSTFTFPLSTVAYGDTHPAANCTSAAVMAAVNAASSGDTVTVPTGTASWSTQGAVDLGTKKITLQGAGIDATVIYLNAVEQDLTIGGGGDISGFTFICSPTNHGAISISGTADFRIHHNRIRNMNAGGGATSIVIWTAIGQGLIDHNTFENPNGGLQIQHWGPNSVALAPLGLGTFNGWLYVEDNAFNSTIGQAGMIDTITTTKFVLRHNTIQGAGVACHGTCWVAGCRGVIGFEIYSNTFTVTTNGVSDWLGIMGGTGVIYDNTIKYYGSSCYNGNCWGHGYIVWQDARVQEPGRGFFGTCDSDPKYLCSNSVDNNWYPCSANYTANCAYSACTKKLCSKTWKVCGSNSDCPGGETCSRPIDNPSSGGYPCLDALGIGPDENGDGVQEPNPMYGWKNYRYSCDSSGNNCTNRVVVHLTGAAGSGGDPDSDIDINIKLNRDFYNDVQKPGYVPAPYPHPLQGGGDTTPPANIATVNDGTGTDVSYTTLTTQLSANWTPSADAQSGIAGYRYAIGTTAGASNLLNWTALGNVASVTKGSLTLTIGATYYFSVKAFNGAGLESAVTNSNGQFVKGDTTPPGPPAAVRDGSGADIASTTFTTQLSANWDAAFDPESNIAKYYYAIGTTAGATDIAGWTDNGTALSVARTGLTLALGTTYYFSVKAQNSGGLQGPAANSNGQVVLQSQDTTPPANIAAVNDGTGTDLDSTAASTQLSANWTASSDAQSGISGYKYAIGTTAGGTNIVAWTLLGNVLAVTKTGLSLTAGATYYFSVKAVNGVGLESTSAKNSDGICVQGSSGPNPMITGLDVTNLTDRSATIVWNTDLDTKGQVQYGRTLNYVGGGEESALGKRHIIDITSLDPETNYHYRVVNIDGGGNSSQLGDYTFRTYALINRAVPIVGKVYPNPYKLTDTTQMTFALSSATGGDIKIYTLSGKLVKNIPVGSGTTDALWNLTNDAGNRINSGLYVYIMQDSDGNKKTGKIVITN